MAKTVLAVDDNADYLRLLELMLTKAGYGVQLADSALRAAELLESEIPDAILLDIMMPVRNGLEFLENLRWDSRFEKVPVIVLTAATLSDEEREFVDAFAATCMDKAKTPTLVQQLNELIGPP